jgi:hypothetical protein
MVSDLLALFFILFFGNEHHWVVAFQFSVSLVDLYSLLDEVHFFGFLFAINRLSKSETPTFKVDIRIEHTLESVILPVWNLTFSALY